MERRTALLKRIQNFRHAQTIVMPGFNWKDHTAEPDEILPASTSQPQETLLPDHDQPIAPIDKASSQPEDIVLFMPSDLSSIKRRKYCSTGLPQLEDHLRYAEACDALEELRHQLRTRSFTNKFKVKNVTGQVKNTRAREVQHRIDDKVQMAELKYKRAREAVTKLRGKGAWEQRLQVLHRSDVRALNERQLNAQEALDEQRLRARLGTAPTPLDDERRVLQPASLGEGHRRPSWIWMSGGNVESVNDPLTLKGLYIYSRMSLFN